MGGSMHWDGGSLFHALGRGEYLQPLHCQYTLRAVKQGVGERSATSPSSVHNSTHPPTPAHTCPHLPTLPLTSRLSSREELSWVWSIVELSACGIEGRRVQGRGERECFRISVTMGCVTGQEEAASSYRTRGTLTPNKCRKSEHSLMIHPPPPSSMGPPCPPPPHQAPQFMQPLPHSGRYPSLLLRNSTQRRPHSAQPFLCKKHNTNSNSNPLGDRPTPHSRSCASDLQPPSQGFETTSPKTTCLPPPRSETSLKTPTCCSVRLP